MGGKKKNASKAEAAPAETAKAEPAPEVEKVGRDKVESYLKKCNEMMKSKVCQDKLADVSLGRPGAVLKEMQIEQWDELGVSRDAGRTAVDSIAPDDKDLVDLRLLVIQGSKTTYLQAVKDRKPSTVIKDGKLPRETVLEFFDAIQIMFEQKEVRDRLKKWAVENGDVPDVVVEEIHAELFELLGWEPKHGREQMLSVGQHLKGDAELYACFNRWQQSCGSMSMEILREAQRDGAGLKCDEQTQARLMEMQAKEALELVSPEERRTLLEANSKKVQIFRSLPPEGRKRYLEKLSKEEKLELMKAELLFGQVMQTQQRNAQSKPVHRTVGKFRSGTEFKTTELVKTVDKAPAAIAKGTSGRVIEVDNDGDLRVYIPSKDRNFYFIGNKDLNKLRVTREGWTKLYQGMAGHTAFGKEAIAVHLTLTGPKTGKLSMVGQSVDVKVEIEKDNITVSDDETTFQGKKNKDGDYEGTVTQEGEGGGHFILKEVPEQKL